MNGPQAGTVLDAAFGLGWWVAASTTAAPTAQRVLQISGTLVAAAIVGLYFVALYHAYPLTAFLGCGLAMTIAGLLIAGLPAQNNFPNSRLFWSGISGGVILWSCCLTSLIV
jgi:hypothetical protein